MKQYLEYLHGTSNEKEFLEMTDLLPFHDAMKACEIAQTEAFQLVLDIINDGNDVEELKDYLKTKISMNRREGVAILGSGRRFNQTVEVIKHLQEMHPDKEILVISAEDLPKPIQTIEFPVVDFNIQEKTIILQSVNQNDEKFNSQPWSKEARRRNKYMK